METVPLSATSTHDHRNLVLRPITWWLLAPPEGALRALQLGFGNAEIRNDLAGSAILDGTPAAEIRRIVDDDQVSLISINALLRSTHGRHRQHNGA